MEVSTIILKGIELADGCIEFQGHTDSRGYGKITVEGKGLLAHRYAFFLEYGYYPDVVMHTCDYPPCINPKHLSPGNTDSNNKDMSSKGRYYNQRKTHCKQGHPYDEENTYHRPKGGRGCRKCIDAASRERRGLKW